MNSITQKPTLQTMIGLLLKMHTRWLVSDARHRSKQVGSMYILALVQQFLLDETDRKQKLFVNPTVTYHLLTSVFMF